MLHDGAGRRGADLADDRQRLVLLDELLRLGDGDPGFHAVLGDELELAAEHAALAVDLLHGHLGGVLAMEAELAEETGERSEWPDLDDVRLRLGDGREADGAEHWLAVSA